MKQKPAGFAGRPVLNREIGPNNMKNAKLLCYVLGAFIGYSSRAKVERYQSRKSLIVEVEAARAS